MVTLDDHPMAAGTPPQAPAPPNRQLAAKSGLRAIFGIVWAINALLSWQPGFANHFVGYLQSASHGQPPWLAPSFGAWLAIVTPHAAFFTIVVRLLETAIALGLLLGLARKAVYVVGAILSALIWSTAEGGPASAVALPRRSWRAQGYAVASILATLAVLFATFQSALSAPTATPAEAAAAVSPLSLAANGPIATAHDASLPPLLGTGPEVAVTIVASDATVAIANGVANQYKDHPLPVKAGQRLRLYVVDAGPNLPTAFHVIGSVFDGVYADGDPAHALTGVSTYEMAPGQGVVYDLTIPAPGQYAFVDHSMRDMSIGAAGLLNVTP